MSRVPMGFQVKLFYKKPGQPEAYPCLTTVTRLEQTEVTHALPASIGLVGLSAGMFHNCSMLRRPKAPPLCKAFFQQTHSSVQLRAKWWPPSREALLRWKCGGYHVERAWRSRGALWVKKRAALTCYCSMPRALLARAFPLALLNATPQMAAAIRAWE
mmetsp:Transcript_52663/g.125831  ORF Transcript_52663/g.125831 Transcript_52663/m.125831 type:complete len:158 (-) Transcript_52663:974-1447(-)